LIFYCLLWLIVFFFLNCSKSSAIKMQFLTAIAAFIGTAFGLYARRHKHIEDCLLAITAGGFVYIATVNILPSISQTSSSIFQIFMEVLCFSFGVSFMVLVAFLE
jgi:zinc transporter 7